MKARSLRQVSVGVTPSSEEAVVELLGRVFGEPPSVQSDATTGRMRATVYLEDASKWSRETQDALRAGLQCIRTCGLDLGPGRVTVLSIRREEWAESWKRHFKPLEIGSKLLLKPSWSRRRPRPGQALMILNPGLSFGTGQHPTTCFCLEQLAAVRKQGTRQSFLDIGTGSGILAIAAAKLGYRPVEALDFDSEAVRIARANARRNRARVRITSQDLTRLPLMPRRRYDIVCANLTSDLLVAERRRILQRLKPSGTLVLAGILANQFEAVKQAYAEIGLKLFARKRIREWESGAFVWPEPFRSTDARLRVAQGEQKESSVC
jgi:ribosomal protein L11 methyltransferase